MAKSINTALHIFVLKEFHQLWEGLKTVGDDPDTEQEIRKEFERMDVYKSGYITKEEMLKLLDNCDVRDKAAEAKKCLDEIDVDGDGRVSFAEFLLMWKFQK